MSFNFKKNFRKLGGTSIVSPELLRDDTVATDTLNVDTYDNFSLCKRRGVSSAGTFNAVNTRGAFTTSSGEKLIFSFGPTPLQRVVEGSVGFNHNGALGAITIKVANDPFIESEKRLIVELADGTEFINLSLGTESSNVALSTVITNFNLVDPNLQMFSFTDDTQPALGLKVSQIKEKTLLTSGQDRIDFEYLENVTGSGIGATGSQMFDVVERDGIVYFTTGSDLYKYDGTEYYRAGLPKPLQPGSSGFINTTGAASTVPAAGTYRYRVIYEYTDPLGNVIQSTPSDEVELSINDLNSALLDIDSDFLGGYPSGVTATILRTKAVENGGGSVYFVVATGVALDTPFNDLTPDANLVDNFVLPPFELNAVTNAKYVEIFRNSLVLTGFPNDPDKVLYEDIEFTEGFSESNSFLTQSRQGGENSGIKATDNHLFVFKEDSIHLVTGDLNTSQFQVDKISDEGIGCVSNASLVESLGRIWFMSKEGIYSIATDGIKEESGDLEAIFEKEFTTEDLRRCVGFNNTLDDKLWFNISLDTFDQNNSNQNLNKTYCYNIKLKKWFIWDTLDFSGGISIKDRDIWMLGQFSYGGANTKAYTRISRTFTELDYSDRSVPIRFEYKSNWETLGEPSVFKKFVRMKIYSIDNQRQLFETPDFTIELETEHNYEYGGTVTKASLRFYELNDPTDPSLRTPVHSRRTRLKPKKAKSMRYILINEENNKNVLISGVETEIAYEHSNFMRSE